MLESKLRAVTEMARGLIRRETFDTKSKKKSPIKRHIVHALERRGVKATKENIELVRKRLNNSNLKTQRRMHRMIAKMLQGITFGVIQRKTSAKKVLGKTKKRSTMTRKKR